MKQLVQVSALPFGVPIGWIAARIAEGEFALALFDTVLCIALIGAICIIDYYVPLSWRGEP